MSADQYLMNPPMAITMGDACGIGPEVVARAWAQEPRTMQGCFVAGDVGVMRRALSVLGLAVPMPLAVLSTPAQAQDVPLGCMSVLQVAPPLPQLPWGVVDARAGEAAGACVQWAAQAALRGDVQALVTAPLHKEALHAAGPHWQAFAGHTELLQHVCAQHMAVPVAQMPVRMMLANDELRTVLVSIHVSLRQALEAITFAQVMQTVQITHDALLRMLGRHPRIALAGVNPHAGEGGLFGSEEQQVLLPVVAQARARGMDVHGPLAPDTVFMRARHTAKRAGEFDVVVAMYHDQGLIPVKYLGVEQGVNVTLGLPLVRTSPDHGTAMDIAGRGVADACSLLQAVRMARQLAGQRTVQAAAGR